MKTDTTRSSGSGRRRRVLVLVIALVGAMLAPSTSAAEISSSDFPSKAAVKSELDGTGRWFTSVAGSARALGAKPARCRSDLQMLSFAEDRVRSYSGLQRGLPTSVSGEAQVAVFRYKNASEAHLAVKRNASYPQRCPKTTEWVCTDCDGVWTTWRKRVAAPQVGRESVVWHYRRIGNFKHNGYGVVARRGRLVVRVEVGRLRTPLEGSFTYPPLISKTEALKVARMALRAAG